MSLTQEMFSPSRPQPRFGISFGQTRAENVVYKNAGWHNSAGDFLGFGDLCIDDLLRISYQILPSDAFVVVRESKRTDVESFAGYEYMRKRAEVAICSGKIYVVDIRASGRAKDPRLSPIEIDSFELNTLLTAKTTE